MPSCRISTHAYDALICATRACCQHDHVAPKCASPSRLPPCGWLSAAAASSGHDGGRDPHVMSALAARDGDMPTALARDLGVSDRSLARWVRRGYLVRPARGVIADGAMWRAAKTWERYRLLALTALCAPRANQIALSHHSALALAGVPIFGGDHRVHMIRLDGRRMHSTPCVAFNQSVDHVWLAPLLAFKWPG